MRLTPGTRLGRYEIIGTLGAGGMGEVYRGRDTRLNRDVAIKALPEPFTLDDDRVARFEREAQLLASLNHPHIASIYGLEEAEHSQFIVLELVEGGTLADRLRAGSIPVADALRIARDIADALHAAHDKGIIHRDLKPANVALTPGGKPKVLDFGLAKAFTVDSTATTLAGATRSGVVLGTAPYMSPEQTRGLPVDKRSDIWSFGCVLYEMLTGRYPFTGASTSDIVVAILERDPDLNVLPSTTPSRVRWLLRRCLEKDPARRLHDIADARIELEEALASPDSASSASGSAVTPRATGGAVMRERVAWTTAALALAGLAAVLVLNRGGGTEPPSAEVYRATLLLPDDLRLTAPEPAARFAVSPDGRRIALVASNATGTAMLWVRLLDSLVAQPIAGTEGAAYPFWSPDSRSIAFTARPVNQSFLSTRGQLRKVDLSGGQPVTLADPAFQATGAWNRDNVILFTPTGTSPLFRVSATSGGTPVPVSTLDPDSGDMQHSSPAFLPDGRHYVYTALGSRAGANDPRALYVGTLDASEPPRLLREGGSNAKFADGHLLFLREGTLYAQRLDLSALQLVGEAYPLAGRVQQASAGVTGGAGAFSASDTGVLVYQTGMVVRSQLAWMDRAGKPLGLLGEPADYLDVALSPDGSRAAVSEMDPQFGTRDLLIFDVERGVHERVTSGPSDDFAPVWSPGGDRIAYSSARKGGIEIYERSATGSGAERMLDSGGSALGKFAASWSRDGWLAFVAGGRALAWSDIHLISMKEHGKPRPFLESSSVETQVRFSPDGQWVAYAANDSRRLEVYVSPFPEAGKKERVSIGGGSWPRWRADGREIFFLSPDSTLMSASVIRQGPSLKIEAPQPLFKVRLRPMERLDAYSYDVAPDGQRFLFNTFVEEATSTGLTLVVNWPAAIR